MKSYIIDPEDEKIEEVDFAGGLEAYYEILNCTCITVAGRLPNGDDIWCDDEGLLKSPDTFFRMPGYPDPFAGRGLVLGCDEEGESIAASCTIEEVKAWISFLSLARCRWEY